MLFNSLLFNSFINLFLSNLFLRNLSFNWIILNQYLLFNALRLLNLFFLLNLWNYQPLWALFLLFDLVDIDNFLILRLLSNKFDWAWLTRKLFWFQDLTPLRGYLVLNDWLRGFLSIETHLIILFFLFCGAAGQTLKQLPHDSKSEVVVLKLL